jgi:2-polyprenyl-3-methyl-5-hydroxy-6-metoxy-1,4-benzoquinol methylase
MSAAPSARATVPCWACGSDTVRPTDRLAPAPYLRCADCGLTFAPERLAAELRALYDEGYFTDYAHGEGYDAEPRQRRWENRLRVRFVRRYAERGRLLDVGCAKGGFLAAAQEADFEVRGVEPADAAAAAARGRGLDVVTGTLDDMPLVPGSLEVVTLWHVLEHIPDPLETLRRLRQELVPGGHLLIEVPNAESVVAEREGGRWHAAEVLYHVSQYGPRSLRALVERAGFTVLDVHTFPFTGYYHPARWVHPGYWRGYSDIAVGLRANPFGRHSSAHELLRLAARS